MTDLDPPKLKIIVLHNPLFFDDVMAVDWTPTHGTLVQDGDSCELTLTSDPGDMFKPTPAVYNSNPHRYLAVLVSEFSGDDDYTLCVAGEGYGFYVSETFTTTGLKILDLYALNSDTHFNYEAIGALLYTTGAKLKIDFAALVDSITTLNTDIALETVKNLRINTPLLNKGVPGATFSLTNFAGEFNDLLSEHDVILIYLARSEEDLDDASFKRFGGRIVSVEKQTLGYGDHFLEVSCHGFAAELLIPPSLFHRFYVSTNARTIIEAALALAVDVIKHPVAANWFDNAGSSGSTDDRINSTHDVDYAEQKLIAPIQELLEKALNPSSVQGFDAFQLPSGALVGHLRNSLDFPSPITVLTPESYVYNRDKHRIRNKQIVYGAFGGNIPASGTWCDSIDNWSKTKGTLSWITPSQVYCDADAGRECDFTRTTFPHEHISGLLKSCPLSAGTIDFYFFHQSCTSPSFQVALYAPDASNCFYKAYSGYAVDTENHYVLDLGPDNSWIEVGSPRWENIKAVNFTAYSVAGAYYVFVKQLKFYPARFRGEAEDPTSQGLYGVRMSEPEIDEALQSVAECTARAASLVEMLKNPVVTLTDVLTDGKEGLWPGQRQHTHGSNDGIDETFRVIEVVDKVENGQWDAIFTLSNEPQLVDMAFALIIKRMNLLERRN